MSGTRRFGQVMVDYVLVLGIVLLVALLAVGLSGYWPDLGLNAKNTQSQTFWRDQARPITVPDAFYDAGDRQIYMALQTQIDEHLSLAGLFLNGQQVAFSAYNPVGADVPACDRASCLDTACACNFALYPRRTERIITEAFGGGLGCRQSGQVVRLPLQMVYYRPAEPTRNLSLNATVELAATCQ